jgi:hypothetical protein
LPVKPSGPGHHATIPYFGNSRIVDHYDDFITLGGDCLAGAP